MNQKDSPLVAHLKNFKHSLLMARKRTTDNFNASVDALYRLRARLKPYRYSSEAYPLDFVTLTNSYQCTSEKEIPRRIWCVWFGGQEMSSNRAEAYQSIQQMNNDLDVVLVTEANLSKYVVAGSPLHPAFDNLSAVHKSDYIHAYLMHHYGGGFTGVKKHHYAWSAVFDRLDRDEDAWAIGYQIPRRSEATWFYGPLAMDIRMYYSRLIGFSGKVMRPNTPLTFEWISELNRRLSYYSDLLQQYPGNLYGDNDGYPVPWTRLGSQIFEPLCLKYLERIRIDHRVKPQLWGHR